MNKKVKVTLFIILVISAMWGCKKIMPGEPASEDVLAEPFSSLTSAQMDLHVIGDEAFAKTFSKDEGLGPIFVQAACEACHVGDGKGHPVNILTRFGKYELDGVTWNSMLDVGGPQLQNRAITPFDPEQIPASASGISRFIAPNVTGLGFLATVEDKTILAMVDSLDANSDGISGTVNFITPPNYLIPDSRYHDIQNGGTYIGRFGRKASAIDLIHQITNAYKQDMGITSENDLEDPINFNVTTLATDNVSDPEVDGATFDAVVFYIQTLEAPRRRNKSDPEVKKGETIFVQIGCEKCHVANLSTGESEIEALNNVVFHAYTDMLLHDMGLTLNDSYTEGTVKTTEWRTMPLWGLGLQQDSQGGQMYLMHDGRASTFEEAIKFHEGEGNASRLGFNALSDDEKEDLIKFLNSL